MQGTKSSRLLFLLVPLVRPTDETGSGLLLKTPSAMDAYSENLSKKEQVMGNSGTLAQEVATGFVYQRGLLLTPTTREEVQDLEKYPNGTTMPNLATQVVGLLPTPSTTDNGSPLTKAQKEKFLANREKKGLKAIPSALNQLRQDDNPAKNTGKRNQDSLQKRAFQTTGKTSQLNPLFVAEMMGFPPNWTVLPFQSGEMNQSKDMETP
jgi:hypothetical protein